MIRKEKIKTSMIIDNCRPVIVKNMGNIRQINISDRLNFGATIKPISKSEYVIVATGEIKEVIHHARDRTENIRNLEKTMRNLRDLINTNVTPQNIKNVRFITLTYADNMTDSGRLYKDFRDFNKRFKRFIAKNNSGLSYEYIVCVEAQGRGAFHLHLIAIFNSSPPFIENAVLRDIWGQGFVKIEALSGNIDNIGAYLTAYLSDLDLESGVALAPDLLHGEFREVHTKKGESKHVIKGARLKLMPAGINIYRHSRGIKKPVVVQMSYAEALEEMKNGGYIKAHESAIKITDTDRNFSSTYVCQTYKRQINYNFRCNGSIKTKEK